MNINEYTLLFKHYILRYDDLVKKYLYSKIHDDSFTQHQVMVIDVVLFCNVSARVANLISKTVTDCCIQVANFTNVSTAMCFNAS